MKEVLRKIGKLIWRHKFIAVATVLIAGGAIYFGYSKNSQESSSGGIQTTTVARGDVSVSVTGAGQVHVQSQVDLKGVAAGDGIEVIEVAVGDGQQVSKGELIAVLDTAEPMKSVRNAQLNLRSAQISQKEINFINDNQTVEEKWKRQSQEISVQQRQMSLSDAYDDLEDYYIRAPFDGIVTDLNVEAGDSVSQSDIIASVITKQMYAEISLNEVDAVKVKEGNDVILTFDALSGISAKGKVSKVDTIGEISQNVISYNAKIEFEQISELLKPGMSVDAEILVESKKDVLYISDSAVKTGEGGTSYVEMVSSGGVSELASGDKKENSQTQQSTLRIAKQKVEPGISNDIITEIKSGLREGDLVILKMNSAVDSGGDSEEKSGGFNLFGGMGGGGMRR